MSLRKVWLALLIWLAPPLAMAELREIRQTVFGMD